MNLHNTVAGNMEYIQKVFVGVQVFMQQHHSLEELIAFLDAEPPVFRSIAYEAASMEMALPELLSDKALYNWKEFYKRSEKVHKFHMDIGLGWAFAKAEMSPKLYLRFLHPHIPLMIYDGIGYYNGLFRGRNTVKTQLIPGEITGKELHGFDQGLGRRLWYISKGEANVLVQLIQPFNLSRHADLWRGVGIACGYVGGFKREHLEQLMMFSNEFSNQLSTGIKLAAISRSASDSVSCDIELACNIICGKSLNDVVCDAGELKKYFTPELEIII